MWKVNFEKKKIQYFPYYTCTQESNNGTTCFIILFNFPSTICPVVTYDRSKTNFEPSSLVMKWSPTWKYPGGTLSPLEQTLPIHQYPFINTHVKRQALCLVQQHKKISLVSLVFVTWPSYLHVHCNLWKLMNHRFVDRVWWLDRLQCNSRSSTKIQREQRYGGHKEPVGVSTQWNLKNICYKPLLHQ